MASEEHKKLADIIKKTHSRLRDDCREYGPRDAWDRHISRSNDLQKYAKCMKELATSHWNSDPLDSTEVTYCRISWIKSQCYQYFHNEEREKFAKREKDIAEKNNIQLSEDIQQSMENFKNDGKKIKLLDVGSCYNPLGRDDNFDVIAIDIAPYSNEVYVCDFLNVTIGYQTIISDNLTISRIAYESFDVCVFSLLLEYFPCPEQRFLCCKKAYELLKKGGILIIITPDSKHVGANAKIMKSWRFVLSNLGFMRIKYEKLQHIHCMCYRKCFNEEVGRRWANLQTFSCDDILFSSTTKIFIPQDNLIAKISEEKTETAMYDAKDIAKGFLELPQDIAE